MKICLSKRASLKRNDDFVEWQMVTKKDGVLLFFMETERQRGFCRFLPRVIVKRRLGAIRKVPWRRGICGQKESRLRVGCISIGSGEWTRRSRRAFGEARRNRPANARHLTGRRSKSGSAFHEMKKPKPFCELRRIVKLVAGNGIEPLTFRL